MKADPVVITGASLISSLGRSVEETWEALLSGAQGAKPIAGPEASAWGRRWAAPIDELDSADIEGDSRSVRLVDVNTRLLLSCALEAFQGAGLDRSSIAREEIGFFVGMGMVDYRIDDFLPAVRAAVDDTGALDMRTFYAKTYLDIHPLTSLSMLNNLSLCQAAIRLDIRGENAVFSPHADSGAEAIVEGMSSLHDGKAKAVLAGGVSETVSSLSLARARVQGVLSDGAGPCRPFAADRNGTVLGEGCAILCLERRASADDRGATYQCAITGYGAAFGAEEKAPAATAEAIGRAMRQALTRAKISPPDIDVVIGHGDGTVIGDQNEIAAIQDVFAANPKETPVFSSKAALGNLLAGAPAVDVILAAAMLGNGIVPATFCLAAHGPGRAFRLVCGEALKVPARRVMVNCRSYAGQCASLLVERVS